VTGPLSTPSTSFTVQSFDSFGDPSGFGEAQTTVTNDSGGEATFDFTLPPFETFLGDHFITATATDPAGSTSEFCQSVAAFLGSDGDGIENAIDTQPGSFF